MAFKDNFLKKNLIKDGIIACVVLAVLTAAGFGLSSYDDSQQEEKGKVQGELASMHGEYDGIKTELGTGYEVEAYYRTYIQNHSDNFLLNREAATGWLALLKDKNHLVNIGVTISPILDVPPSGDTFVLKTGTMVKSDVKISFGALTDTSVFSFIEGLQRNLPGVVIVHDLKLKRTGDLTKNILLDLSQHRIDPLVSGELAFTWIGLRPNPEVPANGK